jgi:hypothetical protein
MTDSMPTNINMLSQLGFKFTLARAPNLVYFTNVVELPGINLSVAEQSTPFVSIPFSGKCSYEDLTIQFKIDENFGNWLELHDWITALGSPVDFSGFRTLKEKPLGDKKGLTSDIELTIMKSSMTPNVGITFKDAFPVSISPLTFSSQDLDVEYLSGTASFRYLSYSVRRTT